MTNFFENWTVEKNFSNPKVIPEISAFERKTGLFSFIITFVYDGTAFN